MGNPMNQKTLIEKIFNQEFFDRIFEKIYEKFPETGLDEYAAPFIPYVGENYSESDKKILFVGKATDGWGEFNENGTWKDISLNKARDMGPERLAELSSKLVAVNVALYFAGCNSVNSGGIGYHSRFWQVIYQLTTSVQQDKSELAEYIRKKSWSDKCFNSIAWTNIFKISKKDGNPESEKFIDFLLENVNTLKEEISILEPDIIIFSTGPSYDTYLNRIFPKIDIAKKYGCVTELKNVYDDADAVLRTWHFQALSNQKVRRAYKLIYTRINKKQD